MSTSKQAVSPLANSLVPPLSSSISVCAHLLHPPPSLPQEPVKDGFNPDPAPSGETERSQQFGSISGWNSGQASCWEAGRKYTSMQGKIGNRKIN